MDWLLELFHKLTDVQGLIQWGGYVALVAIVFSETGLMVGFFLPGDSLLVTAGLFAAKGDLNIWWLNILLVIAAIVGDATGYYIGKRAGQALYSRPNSRFFKREHLLRAKAFYEKHGGKTIILARFVPIIRTFAPTVAGAAEMPYRRFASYNIIGGIGWVTSMTLLGYFLGRVIPNIDKHIHIVIVVVVFLSILPAVIEYLKERNAEKKSQAGA
ncbi:MAG: VTT domain-containing protein [Acidobacteriota bacterium]